MQEPEALREAMARGGLSLLLLQLAASAAGVDDFARRDRTSPQRAAQSYGAARALMPRTRG